MRSSSTRRVATFATVLFASVAPALAGGPTIVAVDCAMGDTISAALATPADELEIQISGYCQERVVVDRDNVTLRGSHAATDGITGPALTDPDVERALVRVSDRRNVRFENLGIRFSEARGLEVEGLAFVEVVNCRVRGNGNRGIQASLGGTVFVENTSISFNDSFDLLSFSGGVLNCTDCTIDDDDGIVVATFLGGSISLDTSTVSSGGSLAILAIEGGFLFGDQTDVTASTIGLYASANSQLSWSGGQVSGSIWSDLASEIVLTDVTQTLNPIGANLFDDASHLRVSGGTLLDTTQLTGFSTGTAANSPTFGTLTCVRGGDYFCDGTETKDASTCDLCPPLAAVRE